ncbi:hypothetical protein GUITHDRAFT_110973 [Guillardia theta CCMP2712]|uniref:PPM-type phosphatase domain-containing protein n=1 Tax=Guillardia theta (strain CCMP2712) TaxID=905079 RepID=L1J462_GUITC|nr:hypothetical protein GUITHDRAFT_110973 [Guillardia theta CCMP2712]EKX42924.1 hypothetical protein GUITHDRAFT_110973 [Guillardia theta CCMP2712]|eukprot:XP_005829904.1 hypothetical protein GUITHDRAFT_110973 [Guillardia theta CCMP2712]
MLPSRKRSRTGSHQDSLAGALPGDQASDAIIISDGEDEELGKEELKLEILQLEQRLEDQTKRTKQYEIESVRYHELLLKCRRTAQSALHKQAAQSQLHAQALQDGLGEVQDMAGAIETTQSKAKEQIDELRKSLEAGSCIFSEAYVGLKGKPGKHMDPRYHGWLPYDDAFEIKDSLTVLCDGVGEGGYRSGIFARKLVESMASGRRSL